MVACIFPQVCFQLTDFIDAIFVQENELHKELSLTHSIKLNQTTFFSVLQINQYLRENFSLSKTTLKVTKTKFKGKN